MNIMAHGERARRLATNRGREYWNRRRCSMWPVPTRGEHQPQSAKRITNRIERRSAKVELNQGREES